MHPHPPLHRKAALSGSRSPATPALLACTLFLLLGSSSIFADNSDDPRQLKETARALTETYKESIVTVRAIIDVEVVVGGSANQAQEQKLEVPGTVIHPNGLTVVSNATIDVGKQIQQQIKRQVRGRQVDVNTTFKEVFLLLSDGTEIAAQVVLKDGDLDVAFILPEAAEVEAEGVTFVPVTFPDDTPVTGLLDPIIILNRLGLDLDREISVYITNVEALIKKPRPFVFTHNTSIGTPAFLADGVPLGLYVRRIVNGSAASTVVLPAREITRLAHEALGTSPDAPADATHDVVTHDTEDSCPPPLPAPVQDDAPSDDPGVPALPESEGDQTDEELSPPAPETP